MAMNVGDTVLHVPTGVKARLIVLGLTSNSAIKLEDGTVHNVPNSELQPFFKFKEGDRVVKFKGDYTAAGEVMSAYSTKAGKPRYVVEYDALPLQHIHSERDLMMETDWLETNLGTFGDLPE